MTNKEIISFTAASSVTIPWNAGRILNFGAFPEVEVYLEDPGGVYYKAAIQPVPDGPPPSSFTQLVIDLGTAQNGFISIM